MTLDGKQSSEHPRVRRRRGTIDRSRKPLTTILLQVAAPPAICVHRRRLPLLGKRYWNTVVCGSDPSLNAQSSGRLRYMLIMGNFQNRSSSFRTVLVAPCVCLSRRKFGFDFLPVWKCNFKHILRYDTSIWKCQNKI